MQWLDELEDLVFAAALLWEPMRRVLLQIGLGAAVGLQILQAIDGSQTHAPVLAGIAFSSVFVWLVGLIALAAVEIRQARNAAAA